MSNPRGNPESLKRVRPEHGERGMYNKGCRCDDCRNAEKRYRAAHYRKLQSIPSADRPSPKPRGIKEQPMGWQDKANCQDRGDLDWIGGGGHFKDSEFKHKATGLAREFCAECPVRLECLQYGIATKSMGVWGGSYLAWEPRKKVVNLLG